MKKKIPYLLVSLISLLIFVFIFIKKDIYPFGGNTLIYGDMFDQITAFYYHFYDAVKGTDSLLIDFSTGASVNFFGILTYYICSPFTFFLLLFERDKVYLAVSIIIALKCILSCLTILYSLRYFFKDKLNNTLSVFLALSYGFSGYFFNLYQITPWMDAVYLFPLLAIGLKKTLDLDKPYMYIIFLTISLYTCFYVTLISLLFIFLISYIYIFFYKDKETRKKSILNLGIATIISILLSAVIIVPSYIEIASSSRLNINIRNIFNSKLGPITDKMAFFIPSGFLILSTLLFLLNIKKNKQEKFVKFIFVSLIITAIPYIIEPVNKILHFGSYAMFPCRYGYITFFLLTILSAYTLINYDFKNFKCNLTLRKIISIILFIFFSVLITIILNFKYNELQAQIYKLTLSGNNLVKLILFGSFLITLLYYTLISFLLNKKDKLYYPLVFSFFIVTSINYGLIYLGNDFKQPLLTGVYNSLNEIYELKLKTHYRTKNDTLSLITNNGMVSNLHNLDHFTSMVDGNALLALKKLGYKSYWTMTFSNKGTMFTDMLLGNKYYLSKKDYIDNYNVIYETKDGYKLHELNKNIGFGYYLNENMSLGERPSLNIQNQIYKNISNDKNDLFKIYDNSTFKYKNIDVLKKYKYYYSIQNKDISNYIEKEIEFDKKSILYLNIINSLYNVYDVKSYKSFDIYINDKLYLSDIPNKNHNGTLNLGTYNKGDKVNIKLVLLKDTTKFTTLELGVMDHDKLMDFIDNNKVDSEISFNKNKVTVKLNSNRNGLYFIPINYIDGFTGKLNGKEVNIVKSLDNYLGINVKEGENLLEFTFIPKGLKISGIVSLITLILTIILFKTKIYNKLMNCKMLLNIVNYIYISLYILSMLFIYIIPTVCFIISYFMYI